jgi:hypothetical protein
MRSLVYEQTPACLVSVLGRGKLLDDEWQAYCRDIAHNMAADVAPRALVFSEGGAPDPRQGRQLQAATANVRDKVRVALITGSILARGILNAYALIEPGYRAFAPDRLDDAIAYLGLTAEEAAEIRAAHTRLRFRLRPSV